MIFGRHGLREIVAMIDKAAMVDMGADMLGKGKGKGKGSLGDLLEDAEPTLSPFF